MDYKLVLNEDCINVVQNFLYGQKKDYRNHTIIKNYKYDKVVQQFTRYKLKNFLYDNPSSIPLVFHLLYNRSYDKTDIDEQCSNYYLQRYYAAVPIKPRGICCLYCN